MVDRVLREYRMAAWISWSRTAALRVLLLNEERSFLRGSVEFFDDDEAQSGEPRRSASKCDRRIQRAAVAVFGDPLDPERRAIRN
jgi:hypothetical protein